MSLRDKFSSILASHEILDDRDSLLQYGSDWTKLGPASPSIVLRPNSREAVVQIMQRCNQDNLPVVPSGGRTGLAGGAVARHKEVVLSLEKLNKILAINSGDRSIEVEAGATTAAVHKAAAEHGFLYPIDLAAKGSSQIGGNIATNAGGVKFIKYGGTRENVIGLEVVLADGSILNLNSKVRKNNAGYDLKQLFIGSEGTLGIITRATLKLMTSPKQSVVVLLGTDSMENLLNILRKSWSYSFDIHAFEFFSGVALKYVQKNMKLKAPFEHSYPFYALIEISNQSSQNPQLLQWLDELLTEEHAHDGIFGESSQQRAEIWSLRENITESLNIERSFLYKNDLAVPVEQLGEFFVGIQKLPLNSKLEAVLFGHIGDGNIHFNLLGREKNLSPTDYQTMIFTLEEELYPLIKSLGGSVSAEHGIGLLKKDALQYTRSLEEVEYMRSIKKIFDPKSILNPGKIFSSSNNQV